MPDHNTQSPQHQPQRITSRDVARLAGVSQATVSLIMNGKYERVSDEVRNRVLAVVKQTGYVPNPLAKGLKERRSYIIATILDNINGPFYLSMVKGIEAEAEQHNYQVLMIKSKISPEEQRTQLNCLAAGHADGLILITFSQLRGPEFLKPLQDCGLPFVLINTYLYNPEMADCVHEDSFGALYKATQHLINVHQRERIAFIGRYTGEINRRYHCEQALAGYKKALADAGLAPMPDLIINDDPSSPSSSFSLRLTKELLDRKGRFTGLVTINDSMAATAMKILTQAGMRIPADVAVIGGANNPYITGLVEPPLTTVDYHLSTIGRTAAERLIQILKEGPGRKTQRVITSSLIVRQSCGCR